MSGSEALIIQVSELVLVGGELEAAIQTALTALEQAGISARDADEFIHDCVFSAWWGWDYGTLDVQT